LARRIAPVAAGRPGLKAVGGGEKLAEVIGAMTAP
jgi:hypothetical protein